MRSRIGVLAMLVGLTASAAAWAQEVPVGGRILLPDGAPLAEAEVTLYPLVDGWLAVEEAYDGKPTEPAAAASTDPDGRFRLHAPAAGLWKVRIEIDGYVPMEAPLRPLLEPTELGDLELRTDAGIQVRVLGVDGSPVSGARVRVDTDRSRIRFFSGETLRTAQRYGVTGEDGSIHLPRGERERVTVSVVADDAVFARRRGLSGTAATLRLRAGKPLMLKAVNAEGAKLPGVLVLLGDSPLPAGRTDTEGTIALRVGGDRGVRLAAMAADGRRTEARLTAALQQVALPDIQAVSGRLIDGETRRPVAGGLVWDSGNPVATAVSDAAGGFVLAGSAGSRLEIVAGASGYLESSRYEFQLNDDGRAGPTVVLRPAAAIEGRVVDRDGGAVAGAELSVQVKQPAGMMRFEIGGGAESPKATSDARGAFRLSRLDPDDDYDLEVEAETFAPAAEVVVGLEPYRTKSGLRIVLSPGHGIRGRVIDAEGRAIREASISARAAAGGGTGLMRIERGSGGEAFEAISTEDGSFFLTGVPAGKFDIEVKRSGFARHKVPAVELVDADPAVDLGEITLHPGERIQGVVRDADGQPLEGVEVRVTEAGGGMSFMMMGGLGGGGDEAPPDARTDPGGWFDLEDLASDARYNVALSRSGFVEKSVGPIDLPRLEPIEASLEAASTVAGRVLDPEREGVPGAQVNMQRSKTIQMGGAVMKTMMMASEETDAEGRFVFEDQEPGAISLSASASGFQEAKLDNIEIPKGEDVEGLELPLDTGSILEGRVLAPDGNPVIGANVSDVDSTAGMMAGMDGTATDGAGYFRLEGLAPGTISVEARHDDYPRVVKDVELAEGINSVELQMEGGQPVEGRVVDDGGNPVVSAAVRLVPAGRYWGGPQTTTEPDGRFSMPGAQDGDYRLWVEADGFAPETGKQSVTVAGEPISGLEVQLGRGGAIFGRVSGIEPERFSAVGVRAEGEVFSGFDGEPIDREGNYRLENLVPGTYNVVASVRESGLQARGQASLTEGEPETQVDLQFGGGITLSGRALQADEPVAGATVYATGTDIDHDGWNRTGEDGSFSIEGLEPGNYRVQLQHFQTGLNYTENLELSASKEIVLDVPTGAVAGSVTDNADRQPLAGVVVQLSAVEESSRGIRIPHSTTTDLEGSFRLDNIPDGSWRLKASKQGYSTESRELTVQFERGAENLDLNMDPTEGLTIEARLPSGGAPDEVRVAVVDPAGNAVTSGDYATGENGRVRLSTVPPGTWELIVSGAGSAVTAVTANAPGTVVPIALEPACELVIRVPDLVESATIATTRLVDAEGRAFRTVGFTGSVQQEWRMTQGRLAIRSLPPGAWHVTVTTTDGRSWQGSSVTAPGSPAEVSLD